MDLRRIFRVVSVLFLIFVLLLVSFTFLFALSAHASFECAQSCSTCLHLAYLQRLFWQLFGGFSPLLGALFLLTFSTITVGLFLGNWPLCSLVEQKARMNN